MLNFAIKPTLIVLAFIALLSTSHASACGSGSARAVVDSLMNMDAATAEGHISSWSAQEAGNPLLDFYRAMTVMVTAFNNDALGPAKRPYEDKALKLLKRAIKNAQRQVDRGSDDPQVRYALGASQAYKAGIHQARGQNFKAYDLGFAGRETLRGLIEDYPDMENAYLALGLYEYFLGSSPEAQGVGAKMMDLSGDRDQGLQYLERAVQFAPDVAPEAARVLLMETGLEEAEMCRYQGLAEEMRNTYPTNNLFAMNARIIALQCRLIERENGGVAPSAGIYLSQGCVQ